MYVDALTRNFGNLVSHHISIAELLSSCDRAKRPCAYADTEFSNIGNVNITETYNPSSSQPPFFTSDVLHRFSQDSITHSVTAYSLDTSSFPYITTLPIKMHPYPKFCTISPLHDSVTPNTAMASFNIPQSLEIQ